MNLVRNTLLLVILFFNFSSYTQESSATLCSDGIDNDGDGLIDCDDEECINISNQGCMTCGSGLGFADAVIGYSSGCTISDQNPNGAIGVSDYIDHNDDADEFVFLGEGGWIKLAFTNNLLSNSGDDRDDLHVFEIGSAVEATEVSLRPHNTATILHMENLGFEDLAGDGYYFIMSIGGATSSIDIDNLISGFNPGELVFDAVKLQDIEDGTCAGSLIPGADIDAICAIYNVDCSGNPTGTAIYDDCMVCLEPSDPEFNQSCIDCFGVTNGLAFLDECGECYLPDDPNINQSCLDCFGIPGGLAIIDECGDCLYPSDPAYNQSCADCAGVPNGSATINECGDCVQPDDPSLTTSCFDCFGEAYGEAVIDDCGDCNYLFDSEFNQACLDCAGVPNGMAQLDECGECLVPTDLAWNQLCNQCELFIPNIFSPDGDGNNDVFKIYSCEENTIQVINLSIYDRLGNLIFHRQNFNPNNPGNEWDGRFENNLLNPAVFAYVATTKDYKDNLKQYAGSISLLY